MIRACHSLIPRRMAALVGVAAIAVSAVISGAGAFRPATAKETSRIAAEVRLTLSILADSPESGIRHGTEIVLAPICISTVDSRYAVAIATPFVRGKVGQPGHVYLHRVAGGGFRVVGGLRVGEAWGIRPPEVPKRAWVDLAPSELRCRVLKLSKLLTLRAKRQAPIFVI